MTPSWKRLSQVFTVETIMTSDLLRWDGISELDELWKQADEHKIDTIPVEHKGYIVGVLQRGNTSVIPLNSEWLISHDTSIPDVMNILAGKSQSCLFVFRQQKVIGIVTPADLNKLPARTYFYNLLAELEMTIAERVRHHYRDEQDAIFKLFPQNDIDEIRSKMASSDLDIDVIHFLNLSQLVNLACKDETLRNDLGFSSANQVAKHMNGLVHLRNDIMHPVRLVLSDATGIVQLKDRIQRAIVILHRLTINGNNVMPNVFEE